MVCVSPLRHALWQALSVRRLEVPALLRPAVSFTDTYRRGSLSASRKQAASETQRTRTGGEAAR